MRRTVNFGVCAVFGALRQKSTLRMLSCVRVRTFGFARVRTFGFARVRMFGFARVRMLNCLMLTLSCLMLLLSSLMLPSCTRYELEGDEVIGDGSSRLTLKISPFQKSNFDVNPSSRAVVGINEVCSRIGFAVFDATGKKVVSASQEVKSAASFGTLQADLNDGIYDIVIVAHSTGGNATLSKPDSIRFTDNKVSDTFSYHERITIAGPQTKEITLKRSVAMFRLHLEECIPQNIKYLKFYYSGGSSTLNAVTNLGRVNSRQTELREVPESAYTTPNNIFEIYTIPHTPDDVLKITITALAADGKTELDEKVFENVPVTQGQITTYKGAIFHTDNSGSGNDSGNGSDGSGGSGSSQTLNYVISADNAWTERVFGVF